MRTRVRLGELFTLGSVCVARVRDDVVTLAPTLSLQTAGRVAVAYRLSVCGGFCMALEVEVLLAMFHGVALGAAVSVHTRGVCCNQTIPTTPVASSMPVPGQLGVVCRRLFSDTRMHNLNRRWFSTARLLRVLSDSTSRQRIPTCGSVKQP